MTADIVLYNTIVEQYFAGGIAVGILLLIVTLFGWTIIRSKETKIKLLNQKYPGVGEYLKELNKV